MGWTSHCASATGWRNGVNTKCWQVMFSTLNYNTLFFSAGQRGNNSGPRDFKIQYKVGSFTTWTDMPADTIHITGGTWTFLADSIPSACNNTDSVYLRWVERDTISVSGGTISNNGYNRIDEIYIWGHNISGIEPPVVLTAYINTLSNINVVFNEPVNATAENIANYTGLGTISSAIRSVTLDTVSLTLSTALTNGNAYTLTIANVQDTASVPMSVPQSYNFLYNNTIASLVFTEINYHNPPHAGGLTSDSLEYIEIYNNSASQALAGGYILNGQTFMLTPLYKFPAGTVIAPNTFMVLAKNANAVQNFYHISGVVQYSNNSLSNTSEKLMIVNTVGNYIDSVTYKSTLPWDTMANGYGPSLTFCNPNLVNYIDSNWTASTDFVDSLAGVAVYGTPDSACTVPNSIENFTLPNCKVICFPNPADDYFTITAEPQPILIEIYDLLGNVSFQKQEMRRMQPLSILITIAAACILSKPLLTEAL